MKLSPYTIASNCTDINDCNAGLDELYEAYDHYKKTGKKAPAYIFSRVEKLEAKRDKCSLKEHGMKYNDYLLSLDLGITEDILQGNSSADFGGMYKNVTVNGEKKKVFVKISHIGKPYNVKKETVRRSWGLDTLQSLDIDIEVFIDGKAYKAVQHQRICSGYHYSYTYKGINIPESDKKLVEVILEEESKTDGLGKTKKVNRKTIDLYNEIIISFKKKDIKHSQNLVLDEYEHLICAFEIRQRQATAIARWSNHLSGTNVKELTELREKINKKIKDWEKADNVSLDDFMLFIALELRLRASGKNDKNFSFYVSIFEKNDCYTLRISDHHFNASTGKKATETTAVTFEKEIKENWDIFKSDKTVKATEYVYYEKELSKESLISIAKDIISFVETGKYNPSVTPNEIHVSPENLQGTYVSRFVEDWKKINAKFKETIVGTYFFAKHIAKLYQQGEKLDWKKAQKIAKDFGIETDTEIMQACELGCVIEARRIAHNGNSLAQQYEEMKDLYDRQVNIKPLDTKSKVLNQYSTPCPLAYLLGTFVNQNHKMNDGKILEPSAGNGLLTTVFNPKDVCVNELDEIRVENLRKLGFYNVANIDASEKTLLDNEYQDKSFRGIITNPPFAKLPTEKKIQRNGWEINTLDYKMAVLALDKMNDNGRASIIVGGKMWNAYWKPLSETSQKQVLFGQWKTFLGYLYAQYNVVDVIYVDGDNIYRKQGTQYPIAIILIDGRHKYDESNKPRYVFDPDKDVIIQTYNQLFDRLFPYVETTQTSDDDEAKRKRAKALMLKMKMAKAKIEIEQTLEGIDEDFADKLNEFIIRGYKLTDRTDYFSCGYPQEVLQLCDLDANTEIVITQSGMQKILGVKKGKQDEAHDLTPIEILRLPQLLREPILVINGNTSDSRLIFIEIPRAGRKVFAVINVDSDMILKRKRNFYNLVASTYSQENFKISTKINQACATNSVWYYDSRKIKNWLSSMGELRLFPLLEANSLSNEKDVEPKTNIQ